MTNHTIRTCMRPTGSCHSRNDHNKHRLLSQWIKPSRTQTTQRIIPFEHVSFKLNLAVHEMLTRNIGCSPNGLNPAGLKPHNESFHSNTYVTTESCHSGNAHNKHRLLSQWIKPSLTQNIKTNHSIRTCMPQLNLAIQEMFTINPAAFPMD